MLETAYSIIEEAGHELTFASLYEEVAKILSMTDAEKDARIGDFYTELTLDGRFVTLVDNTWDLRARHVYDKVHIDVNSVYSDAEEADVDEEEVALSGEEGALDVDVKSLEEGEEGTETVPGAMSDEDLSSLGVLK